MDKRRFKEEFLPLINMKPRDDKNLGRGTSVITDPQVSP
jgi:hypothetical protein